MTETDQTMQAVMTVYRREVAELEAEVERLNGVVDSHEWTIKTLHADAKIDHDREVKLRNDLDAKAARIEKLEHINTTLKIELANEREAHTKDRESAEGDK